jgi:Fe2+ transport system protein FeoA
MRSLMQNIFQRLAWPGQTAHAKRLLAPCHLELLGECDGRCLDECVEGMEVLVTDVPLRTCCQQRLRELGIIEGENVRLLTGHDPVVVLAKDSRIALERSMARQIHVSCNGRR